MRPRTAALSTTVPRANLLCRPKLRSCVSVSFGQEVDIGLPYPITSSAVGRSEREIVPLFQKRVSFNVTAAADGESYDYRATCHLSGHEAIEHEIAGALAAAWDREG
jgi:hypothetical protein